MIRHLLERTAGLVYSATSLGMAKRDSFTRFAMYRSLRGLRGRLPGVKRVLSISHSTHLAPILGFEGVTLVEANYPEFNLLSLPFKDGEFDACLSDQVLEHIAGPPERAVNEALRVVRPGGYVVHTTCLLTAVHGPGDFWRFTPEGLDFLHRDSCEVLEADGWGNTMVPLMTFLGFTWRPVPVTRWHPVTWLATANRRSYAHMVWVAARKREIPLDGGRSEG